jgi:hypothetical protein
MIAVNDVAELLFVLLVELRDCMICIQYTSPSAAPALEGCVFTFLMEFQRELYSHSIPCIGASANSSRLVNNCYMGDVMAVRHRSTTSIYSVLPVKMEGRKVC